MFWLFLNLLGIGYISALSSEEYFPCDGTWYCEEPRFQLSFDGIGDCYYLIDGERISCACGSGEGSRWLTVGCQETDSEFFALAKEVFGAEFVSLDQDKLIVYDNSAEKEYVFYRIR